MFFCFRVFFFSNKYIPPPTSFFSSLGLGEINYMHELLTNMVHKRCVSNDAALFLPIYYCIVPALNNSDRVSEQLVIFVCSHIHLLFMDILFH